MKTLITNKIVEYVKNYPNEKNLKNLWQEPIVGFADANGSYIKSLKEVVTPAHMMPEDFMENPNIIIPANAPIIETGTAKQGINVAFSFFRNKKITITTSKIASNNV